MDIPKNKIETIQELLEREMHFPAGKQVIAICRTKTSPYWPKSPLDIDVSTQEITINDLIEYVKYLNKELKTHNKKYENYNYQEWPKEYPVKKNILSQENTKLNQEIQTIAKEQKTIFDILDFID